jgi:hypothetical protein
MKKTLIAITIATLSTVALAEGGPTVVSGSGATATNTNLNGAYAGNAGVTTGSNTVNFSSPGTVEYKGGYNIATTTKYSGGYDLNNVPAVTAPNLTTTLTETCMGSSSVGGAGAGFGFSFGTTWRDTACVRRLDARQVHSLGDAQAAKEVMCESESVKAAFARVGRPCAADAPATAAGSIVSQPVAAPVAKVDVDVEQIPAASPWHTNIH